MLKDGDYVRMLMPSNTRLGTIEGTKVEQDKVHYLLHGDPRIADPRDFYVLESEVELCEKPDDAQVKQIKRSH
jgi:hypothetical protein